jgi:uncharacterized protein (TIGR03067 family)
MSQLEGEWSIVSSEIDGQALPHEGLKDNSTKMVVKERETTVTLGAVVLLKAKITVDPSKKPKRIDYTIIDGGPKGKTQLGIYELDGDTVKLCIAWPGMDRPVDFRTQEGDGRTLDVWKRVKE